MRRLPHVFALLSAQSRALVDLSMAELAECGNHVVISLDSPPLTVAPVGVRRLGVTFQPTMLTRHLRHSRQQFFATEIGMLGENN